MVKHTLVLPAVLLVVFLCASGAAAEWYTMQPGDNLWNLAQDKYGDGRLYTVLGNYNKITNHRAIPVGKRIWIPSKSELEQFRDAETEEEKETIQRQGRENQRDTTPPDNSGQKARIKTAPFDFLEAILHKTESGTESDFASTP